MKGLGQYPLPHEDDDTFDTVLQRLSDAPAHVRRVFHAIATARESHLDEYTICDFVEEVTATHALVLHRDRHHVLGIDLQAGIFVHVDHADARRLSLEAAWCRVDEAANRFLGEPLSDGCALAGLSEADFVAEITRALNASDECALATLGAFHAARTSADGAPTETARALLDHPSLPDALRREVERALVTGNASLGPHRAVARFDIAQVISATASEARDLDVRLLMERIAGRYILATPNDPARSTDEARTTTALPAPL